MNAEVQSGSIMKGVGLALLGFAIFTLHDTLIKSIDDIPAFQTVFFVVLFGFVPFTYFLAPDVAFAMAPSDESGIRSSQT